MKIIEQSWHFESCPPGILEKIERAGRTCYKTEDRITEESAEKFVSMLLKRGHESVLEHINISVRFITNRGVTHELVRHRLASYSQESTRYVAYKGEIEFIKPVWWNNDSKAKFKILLCQEDWMHSMEEAEIIYHRMLKNGWPAEYARDVLPNALKTEIVMTANIREWRHVFSLRTSEAAHPQIRALMKDCLKGFQDAIPVLFDDIIH